jgi:von Willebrand factor type A domain/Putative Flp pilus-assembly TadE/G-like
MMRKSPNRDFRRGLTMLLARFLRDAKGGVAPLLALSMIPILTGVTASLDYSRAAQVRNSMQSALDATGLMLSKTAKDLDPTVLNDKATEYFKGLFKHPEAKNVTVTTGMTQASEGFYRLAMTGKATVDTLFGGMVGQPEVDLSVNAEVVWGIKKLHLTLALDNTGSMASSGKMTALKEAAHNLLATLEAASKTPGDVQIAIVPFAVDVNVGSSNVGTTWIDWTDWNSANGTCSRTSYNNQHDCVANGKTWTPADHSTWNGCVKDRDQNNDVLNTNPVAGSASTMYRAHQASSCPTAMMPLSTSWTALNSKIDAMTPAGNTNVTIGLQMAWQTLSIGAPFNAPPPATNLDKVIILLTDGENTQNRWTTSKSSINARTEAACTNAKAANIRLYTVRVIDGDATLLKNCATKPSMYYDVQQASQLNAAFGAIADNLANLRIDK